MTGLAYDVMGRVTRKTVTRLGAGGPEITVANNYDNEAANDYTGGLANLGRLTDATTASGTLRYDYNAAGRLVRQRFEGLKRPNASHPIVAAQTIATGYWPSGEIKSRRFPASTADGGAYGVNYAYDAAGRLFSVKGGANAPYYDSDWLLGASYYNARGQAEWLGYGNGLTSNFAHDPARGWLTSVKHGFTNSSGSSWVSLLSDTSYTRDGKGMIRATRDAISGTGNWDYGYDEFDRLIGATSWDDAAQSRSYAYDQAGNMTKNTGLCGGTAFLYPPQGASSGHPHAPASICGEPVAYDANGNTTDYTVNGVLKHLDYDAENRPVAVKSNGSLAASYTYGPDGERLRKLSGNGYLATHYLGGDVEIETTPLGTLSYNHYLHADVERQGGALRWLHKDHLASNRLITDQAGAVVQRLAYGPYGMPTTNAPAVSKAYINEKYDSETGLLNLRSWRTNRDKKRDRKSKERCSH